MDRIDTQPITSRQRQQAVTLLAALIRLDADAVEHAVITALVGFYRDQHYLIADAITAAQASHQAGQDGKRAELAAAEHELARTGAAIDRYLAAFENGTLEPEDLAERLAPATSARPSSKPS